MTSRSFLLLQGVASPFFSELEKALNKAGHSALKINFCGGDLLSGRFFSTALKHLNFRDTIDKLPDFYHHVFEQYKISDIILFGDTRPVHAPAIKLAKEKHLNIHVFEEGYFRPNWVTLEQGGVNAHSSLPKDPNWFRAFAKDHTFTSQDSDPTGGGLTIRAWHDIRYHLAKALLKPMFPHYRTHRPDSALKEYWGFVRRIPMVKLYYNNKSQQQIREVISSQKPFYLLPLQLGADSQIRIHSPVKDISELIQMTIKSFAQFAPKEALLLIKNHPLDPWFIDYPKLIQQTAKEAGISQDRLVYLEAGDLVALLKKASGTVLVNSTVGTSSLSHNCPVIALGDAIYDMPGLTYQGTLDDFWNNADLPNKELFDAFRAILIENTQINGSFYNQKGIQMAVKNCLPLLNTSKAEADKNLESTEIMADLVEQ